MKITVKFMISFLELTTFTSPVIPFVIGVPFHKKISHESVLCSYELKIHCFSCKEFLQKNFIIGVNMVYWNIFN